jgi:hypothetical protein
MPASCNWLFEITVAENGAADNGRSPKPVTEAVLLRLLPVTVMTWASVCCACAKLATQARAKPVRTGRTHKANAISPPSAM